MQIKVFMVLLSINHGSHGSHVGPIINTEDSVTSNNEAGSKRYPSSRIHVWYMCLHLGDFFMVNVGNYTSPMDPMRKIVKT